MSNTKPQDPYFPLSEREPGVDIVLKIAADLMCARVGNPALPLVESHKLRHWAISEADALVTSYNEHCREQVKNPKPRSIYD